MKATEQFFFLSHCCTNFESVEEFLDFDHSKPSDHEQKLPVFVYLLVFHNAVHVFPLVGWCVYRCLQIMKIPGELFWISVQLALYRCWL